MTTKQFSMIYAFLNMGGYEMMLILAITLLPLVALIDILRSKFEPINKLIWVIVVVFMNILGAVLYFLIGRKQKVK